MELRKKLIHLLQICSLALFIISCDKVVTYDENFDNGLKASGPPVITKVTTIDNQEFSIDKSEMDKVILLHGSNLSNVKAVYFNDLQADYSEIYAANKMLGVRIPAKMPLDINNQVKVITEKGEISFPFEVIIPQLAITGISNEFAAAKDTVAITGQYFDLYDITIDKTVVLLNSTPINLVEATSNSLVFEIPNATIPDNSVITVDNERIKAIYGEPFKIPFHNKGAFTLINFATRTSGNKEAVMTDGTAAGDPSPLLTGQKFLRIKDKNMDPWSWMDLSWTFMEPIPNEAQYADLLANPSNYYLKFEMLTNSPINAAQVRFAIGSALNWSEKEYRWEPAKGGVPFNTNKKWQTVTIDCANFGGLPPLNPGTIIDAGQPVGANYLVINFVPQAHSEKLDFCYTNFRFVKK